jgi:hypothetical protein
MRVASTRDVVARVRLRDRELAEWKTLAARADVTLSEWIRAVVDAHIRNGNESKAIAS